MSTDTTPQAPRPLPPGQVYAYLTDGGIIEAFVTRGDVDLIIVDWDEFARGLDNYELEDLTTKRDQLLAITNPAIRRAALSDINDAIKRWLDLFGDDK